MEKTLFTVKRKFINMNVVFSQPTEDDYRKFTDSLTDASCLEGRVKITAQTDDGHTAELFVEQAIVDRLGEEYIRSHITVYYIESLCGWFAKISENDYYNDPERNPEKVIHVKFAGIENGTGREVYKDIETWRYYLRENHFPVKTLQSGTYADKSARPTTAASRGQTSFLSATARGKRSDTTTGMA